MTHRVAAIVRQAQLEAEQAELSRARAAEHVATSIAKHYQFAPLSTGRVDDPQRKG